MIRVIRDRITGKFLSNEHKWTTELEKARTFKDLEQAQLAAVHLNLKAVELFCRGREPGSGTPEYTLPLG